MRRWSLWGVNLTLRTVSASTIMSWSEVPLRDGSQDHVVAMVERWPLVKVRSMIEAPFELCGKWVNTPGVFWRE